ncbi:MAG TPA: FAD-binding oxidoreductase, partial [Bacteroidales bacterium]|nr:FAD-binding oxidoreductase [Bacteroidales bacterium]
MAKGTDASFYRLVPELVVQVNNERELQLVVNACRENKTPFTIKAGGTSLSGQTVTDSVLVEIGPGFTKHFITNDGKTASFQPGVRGGYANLLLSRYGRKIGPSPASISSAKIGGIVANNASGASYGIATNSYNTILGMRIVFADGSILDTLNKESRRVFTETHRPLVQKITELRKTALADPEILDKIKSKYKLKNTCGYGVNSLIDFEDPIDIISHLMIGSEGTLGMITEVTFETIKDNPLKACSLVFFPDVHTATQAIMPLRGCKVSAAELMDRNALRSVENNAGLPEFIKTLDKNVAALLIETSAETQDALANQIIEIREKLNHLTTIFPIEFTQDKKEFQTIWKVRKGLFTSAAAARPKGTACIIEDVAFPGEVLGEAIPELQELLYCHHYESSVIWGHLLDGNIHFLISPDFSTIQQMDNYKSFMQQLSMLVVAKYNGSLKAEHGTGRNMAAFVKYEWGAKIYDLMRQIKQAFDPDSILNPGVIINDDPEIYAKHTIDAGREINNRGFRSIKFCCVRIDLRR